jgi:hypothetical protein
MILILNQIIIMKKILPTKLFILFYLLMHVSKSTTAQCSLPTIPSTSFHPKDNAVLDMNLIWTDSLKGTIVIDSGKTVTFINATNIYQGTLINYGTILAKNLVVQSSATWYNMPSGVIQSDTIYANKSGIGIVNKGYIKTSWLRSCCASSICLGQNSRTIIDSMTYNTDLPIIMESTATYAFMKVYGKITGSIGSKLINTNTLNICNASPSTLSFTGDATVTPPLCTAAESSLPLHIISFDVQQEGSIAIINWVTSGNSECELQYSNDGKIFTTIVQGSEGKYSFLLKSGTNMFRLKSNKDNTYSQTKVIQFLGTTSNIEPTIYFDIIGNRLTEKPKNGFYIMRENGFTSKHIIME